MDPKSAEALQAELAKAKEMMEKLQKAAKGGAGLPSPAAAPGAPAAPAAGPNPQSVQQMLQVAQSMMGQLTQLSAQQGITPPQARPPAPPPQAPVSYAPPQPAPRPPGAPAPVQAPPAPPRATVPTAAPAQAKQKEQVIPSRDSFGAQRSYSREDLLGSRTALSSHEEAQREARRLRVLQKSGVRATTIANEIAKQVSEHEDAGFRKSLVAEVKPQLEEMATSLASLAPEERQEVLDGIGRVAMQVGPEQAQGLSTVLSAGAVSEAEHLCQLAKKGKPPVEVVSAIEQALSKAPSLAYRNALVDAAGPLVREMSKALAGAPAETLRTALGTLSRAAELLGRSGSTAFAASVAHGLADAKFGSSGAAGLSAELGRSMISGPHGAILGVELGFALKSAGKVGPADDAFRAAAGALLYARTRFQESIQKTAQLETRFDEWKANVAPTQPRSEVQAATERFEREHGQEAKKLEEAASLLSSMLEGAGLAVDLRPVDGPQRSVPERQLDSQSLVVLATLESLCALEQGERALIDAAAAQNQGEPSFLDVLPRAASELGLPQFESFVKQSGFDPMIFADRGRELLQRCALALGHSLAQTVRELRVGGRGADARSFLKSVVTKNPRLFGLQEKGGTAVAAALEEVLESGGSRRETCLQDLERVGAFYSAHTPPDPKTRSKGEAPPAIRALGDALGQNLTELDELDAPLPGRTPAALVERVAASPSGAVPPLQVSKSEEELELEKEEEQPTSGPGAAKKIKRNIPIAP